MAKQKFKFTIPEEFTDRLTYTGPKDDRSEEESLRALSEHQEVTSEKNIWCYWHAGLANLPAWCKHNIVDWIRINGPSWTVRVLDTVPGSANHVLRYVPEAMLPETLVKGTMDGPYSGPHAADMLRGACLYLYGGVYMDVGNIMIRELDRMGWSELEDPNHPHQICVPHYYETLPANHWVMSRKGDPFIKRWHDLFVYLWKDRTNYNGLGTHPLMAFAASMDFSKVQELGAGWEFAVGPEVVFQYITQVLAWVRLSILEEPGEDGFNGAEYQRDHIRWFRVLPECWPIEVIIGWRGQYTFDALATRLDADPASEQYQKAYKVVWQALTSASMEKVTHGKNLTQTPALGVLWDRPDNEGKDIEPGTFAELLRYGSTHFRQTRKDIQWVQTEKPAFTIKKGLFEP